MKMPMLFNTKEEAEKKACKFCCEGAHKMDDKWMPCSMHKHNHQKRGFYPSLLDRLSIINN